LGAALGPVRNTHKGEFSRSVATETSTATLALPPKQEAEFT
jgi:hypothetical protein